jgi:hypothetical protein
MLVDSTNVRGGRGNLRSENIMPIIGMPPTLCKPLKIRHYYNEHYVKLLRWALGFGVFFCL